MAEATVTTSVAAFPAGIDATVRNAHLYGSIAIGAGGTYVTNGLPVTFNENQYDVRLPVRAASHPIFVEMYSPATGFVYKYDPVNNTIRIYEQTTVAGPLVELANLATVTADTLQFHAVYQRG